MNSKLNIVCSCRYCQLYKCFSEDGTLRHMLHTRGLHDETRDRARETPNAANQVQYPEVFNSTVPVIIATPMQKNKTLLSL